MTEFSTRREMLTRCGQVAVAGLWARQGLAQSNSAAESPTATPRVRYCLNTSTIRGHELPLAEEVKRIAAAGYDGVEPWIREIDAHVDAGHSLADLRKQIADLGLSVVSAIGFAEWIVDDDQRRSAGLEQLKRDMDRVRQIGGTRIAAPPTGATRQSDLNLDRAAERYAAALRIGQDLGVTPQLEVWGFSASLSRLSEVMYVAIAAGHPDACLLPDVYHFYKGGVDFRGLAMVGGAAVHVMHLNDYPDIPRDQIQDRDRVYPGDGVAPLDQILRQLRNNGFAGTYSLELFNPTYWQQPVDEVLTTGLAKMQAAVASSFG